MSQGPKAVPEAGAAGGVGVTPSQMFEGLQVMAPLPPLQPHAPIARIATRGICFRKSVVLIQEYPPRAQDQESARRFVPRTGILSRLCRGAPRRGLTTT